ncbi:MAG TPA: hypothetical protein VJ697_11355 [Nitrososphaeraceae archaeon]|nr:hypothetical protein [Nitrososphaeraceae archaeon]
MNLLLILILIVLIYTRVKILTAKKEEIDKFLMTNHLKRVGRQQLRQEEKKSSISIPPNSDINTSNKDDSHGEKILTAKK